jgi:hypothetical protein
MKTGMRATPRIFLCILTVLLTALAHGAPVFALRSADSLDLQEAEGLFLDFKGLTSVHLRYECTVEIPQTTAELRAQKDGGGDWVVLESQYFEAPGTFTGIFRHAGLTPGSTYNYQIAIGGYGACGGFSVLMNNEIKGKLLFNETIDGAAAGAPVVVCPEGLTVPAGRKLKVQRTFLDGLPVYVYGKLILGAAAETGLSAFHLYSKHRLENAANVTLHYGAGSAGSVLEGGHDVEIGVRETSSLTVSNVESLIIQYTADNSKLSVVNCMKVTFEGVGGHRPELSAGDVRLKSSTVYDRQAYPLLIQDSVRFQATGCLFRYGVEIRGGSPVFRSCYLGARLVNRNRATFEDCFASLHFVDDLTETLPRWATDSAPTPIVNGNSLFATYQSELGKPATKIPLGPNYYGDANGPAKVDAGFLHRGSVIDPDVFRTAPHLATFRPLEVTAFYPTFGGTWVVGQSTLTHDGYVQGLFKGRETLLSVDVRTSHATVSGAKVYAIFDDQRIDPPGKVILHRDVADYGPKADFYGKSTVNIILPPTQKSSVTLTVYLDTTGVTGYEEYNGKLESLGSRTLYFDNEPARKFRLFVQPVRLLMPFFSKDTPDGPRMKAVLENMIPAMLPLGSEKLHVLALPPIPYGGILSTFSTTVLLNNLATALWAAQGLAQLTSTSETGIDRFVVVLEKGAMGSGVTGANLRLRRGIIFVDESDPGAALHEMGHSFEMYLDKEQYDQYEPAGLQPEGVTAFINEEGKRVPGFMGSNRVLHFPSKNHTWYSDTFWYDLMGSSTVNCWPIPSTLSAFRDAFIKLLGQADAGPAAASEIRLSAGPPPPGIKRLFVTALGSCEYGWFYMKQGTGKVMDITSIATGSAEPPIGAFYRLEALDADGNIIYIHTYTMGNPYCGEEQASWFGTFDVPEATTSIKLINVGYEKVLLAAKTSGAITTEISSPQAGALLGKTVTVKWKTTVTGKPRPLLHTVLFSNDDGATWTPCGLPSQETSLEVPTGFLKAGDQLAVKVVSSDGLGSGEDEVHGLTLENRPPVAVITSPRDGAVAEPGVSWTFSADAYDVEDGLISSGKWSSSLDGDLRMDKGVVLSEGAHEITFTAKDGSDRVARDKVNVTVRPMPTVDLALEEDALAVIAPGRDPLDHTPPNLEVNSPNKVALKIGNTGANTAFTASLHVKGPDGKQKRLASRAMSLGPFEQGSVEADYTPKLRGHYEFSGEISHVSPEDSSPANNTRAWLVDAGVVAAPSFGPGPGKYAKPQEVAIWSTSEGAAIRYTIDGTEPSRTHGARIPNGRTVTVSETMTLKAMAYKKGLLDSEVSKSFFQIGP